MVKITKPLAVYVIDVPYSFSMCPHIRTHMHGPALSSRSFDMYHMCAGLRWVWNPQMLLPCMAAGVSIQGRTVLSKPPPPLHEGAEKRPGWPRAT